MSIYLGSTGGVCLTQKHGIHANHYYFTPRYTKICAWRLTSSVCHRSGEQVYFSKGGFLKCLTKLSNFSTSILTSVFFKVMKQGVSYFSPVWFRVFCALLRPGTFMNVAKGKKQKGQIVQSIEVGGRCSACMDTKIEICPGKSVSLCQERPCVLRCPSLRLNM